MSDEHAVPTTQTSLPPEPEPLPIGDIAPKIEPAPLVTDAPATNIVETLLDTPTSERIIVPSSTPPPRHDTPLPKKSGKGVLIALIALLLLVLPASVYFISQQNQQLADTRSRATGDVYQNCVGLGGLALTICQETGVRPTDVPTPQPTVSTVGCFLSGTQIQTPNGDTAIETLQEGDVVYAFDSTTGSIRQERVTKRLEQSSDHYYLLSLDNGTILHVTGSHPMYRGSDYRSPYMNEATGKLQYPGFEAVSHLNIGDILYQESTFSSLVPIRVKSLTKVQETVPVYNLTVSGTNTYFAEKIAVHNKYGVPTPIPITVTLQCQYYTGSARALCMENNDYAIHQCSGHTLGSLDPNPSCTGNAVTLNTQNQITVAEHIAGAVCSGPGNTADCEERITEQIIENFDHNNNTNWGEQYCQTQGFPSDFTLINGSCASPDAMPCTPGGTMGSNLNTQSTGGGGHSISVTQQMINTCTAQGGELVASGFTCANATTGGCNTNGTFLGGSSLEVGEPLSIGTSSCGSGQIDIGCKNATGFLCTIGYVSYTATQNCSGGGGGGGGGGDTTGDDTTETPVCQNIKLYKDGAQVTDLNALRAGDDVVLSVKGNLSPTNARFRINGGTWTETATTNSSGEYTLAYTVQEGITDFVIEGEVFTNGAWH